MLKPKISSSDFSGILFFASKYFMICSETSSHGFRLLPANLGLTPRVGGRNVDAVVGAFSSTSKLGHEAESIQSSSGQKKAESSADKTLSSVLDSIMFEEVLPVILVSK